MIAAVLAGGRGRRMGGAKPGAMLGGRALVAWPVAAATAAGLEVAVVAKAATALPSLGVPVWLEPDEPAHPLAGLVFALERAGAPIVALACDMPFVSPGLIARLAAAEGTTTAGQPFPGRYDPADLPSLRAALERQAAVKDALAPAVIGADPAELAGVNTPEELAAASLRL